MKKKEFKDLIVAIEKQCKVGNKLYKSKIDLTEYDEMFHKIISILAIANFTEDGWDMIQYFLYEAKKDGTACIWDENDEEIPMNTVDDLYDYLVKTRCIK